MVLLRESAPGVPPMTPVAETVQNFLDKPDADYWQECRRRAERLNMPAWLLAENEFRHRDLDRVSDAG